MPLAVDLLLHYRERYRPSSTGRLIERVLPAARTQVWRNDGTTTAATLRRPGRELWVLHPQGEPVPAGARPEEVQVVLLDGAWSEAATMARVAGEWGRRVSLPLTGESRYWLREQQEGGKFSTVEALLFLLTHFGLSAEGETLRQQFELHVYASLRSRGRRERAEAFLAGSPVPDVFPGMLAELQRVRPREP